MAHHVPRILKGTGIKDIHVEGIKDIDEEDIYTDCKVKKEWVKNFEELTNEDFPLKSTDIIKKKDFLNKSIKKFLEQKNPTLDGKSLMEVMPDSSILIKDKLTFKKGN